MIVFFFSIYLLRLTTFFFVVAVGDIRSFHSLPFACAQVRVPSGSGGADPLQHVGGQDQPGYGLPAGGFSQVGGSSTACNSWNGYVFVCKAMLGNKVI